LPWFGMPQFHPAEGRHGTDRPDARCPANGLPEVWENLFGGGLSPSSDGDTGPQGTSPVGDGFLHRRRVPRLHRVREADPDRSLAKDLFVHLVNPADSVNGVFVTSPACGASCLGGGTITYPTPTAPNATLAVEPGTSSPRVPTSSPRRTCMAKSSGTAADGAYRFGHESDERQGGGHGTIHGDESGAGILELRESIFAGVYTLIPPERLHVLGSIAGMNLLTNEWVDSFVSLVPAQTLIVSDSVNDRTVNVNRLYGAAQRGVRVMEGLNTNSSSVLGWSFGVASPNQSGAGNTVVFTQRIINYITSLVGTSTTLKYSTADLINGVWTWRTPILIPTAIRTTTSGTAPRRILMSATSPSRRRSSSTRPWKSSTRPTSRQTCWARPGRRTDIFRARDRRLPRPGHHHDDQEWRRDVLRSLAVRGRRSTGLPARVMRQREQQ